MSLGFFNLLFFIFIYFCINGLSGTTKNLFSVAAQRKGMMPLFLGWRCSRALLKLNTTTTTTAATATATATSLLNLIRHNSSFPSSQHHHHEPAMSLMRFRSIPPKRGILFLIARLNLTPSTLYLHMPQTHCMSPSTASQINHASNSTIFTWLGTF